MNTQPLLTLIQHTIDEMKGTDIITLDVQSLTTITDHIIICSGRSQRHVKAIAKQVIDTLKKLKTDIIGVEGLQTANWILIDVGEIVLHVMLPEVREYYALEKLWSVVAEE